MRWFLFLVLGLWLLIACQSPEDPFNRHGELVFTRHARCRMDCRHITVQEIKEILDKGSINYSKK